MSIPYVAAYRQDSGWRLRDDLNLCILAFPTGITLLTLQSAAKGLKNKDEQATVLHEKKKKKKISFLDLSKQVRS